MLDRGLGAAFEAVDAALDAVFEAGLEPVDSRDAITVISELECLGRRVDAARADLVRSIDRCGLHREDRHASAKVMVRHVGRLSDAEAAGRARAANAMADLPRMAELWASGELGTAQVARISRVYANKRVRDALIAAEDSFVRRALNRSYRSFDAWVTGWVSRVDQDGTCDAAQRSHDRRDATMTQDFDKAWELSAHGGPLAGAQMLDVFRHFIEAEFKTDWDKAVAQHGDATCATDLARTDSQRRFDALAQIFEAAATGEPGGVTPQLVTNIVMDWATYQRELRRLTGAPVDPADPNDDSYKCSTIDGHPIDPTEATAASLTSLVRRHVIGADSVTIDSGRKQRLFRGSAALAARLSSVYCYWPGCYVPTSQCQIDHLTPYADRAGGAGGGSTNPGNGGPACGKHNRAKEHGYNVWRTPDGEWHIQRPGGTQIT